jgi:23S rRNA G2445 N2-methylase RlmL
VLALAGWTPGTPLLDPMCGSGTIAIEAALAAADFAPGLQRTFGFQKLAWYDGPTWQRIRQRARDRMRAAPATPSIFASDTDPRAVAQCRRNAAAAECRRGSTSEGDVLARARRPPPGSTSNPASGSTTRPDWRRSPETGRRAEAHFPGWTASC